MCVHLFLSAITIYITRKLKKGSAPIKNNDIPGRPDIQRGRPSRPIARITDVANTWHVYDTGLGDYHENGSTKPFPERSTQN